MPTGYTEEVQSGKVTELRDFVLRCARAFGACIEQRDDDPKDPPKERVVDTYHSEMIEDTLQEIEKLRNISNEDLFEEEKSKLLRNKQQNLESIEEKKKQKERYESMLEKVNSWNPPTEDHQGLKMFMLEQLENSLGWDCDIQYNLDELDSIDDRLENLNLDEIRTSRMESLHHAFKYHPHLWTCRIQPRRTPLQNQTIRMYPVRSHALFSILIPNHQPTPNL